ncbi:glycosyltransferase domain-containing protein [Parabacteroides sp.]
MNKYVIYTCLTGGYDDLKQPECIYDGYDYICFSNDFTESRIGVWEIRRIPFETADKSRLSRFVKINPHLALPEYEYSLWMDSNLRIIGDGLKDKLDELILKDTIMAFVPHPIYNCI